ncbi:MAG: DegT/DnrJ/EryC1/StrS family aminotransferase [Caldilineaceae bacterium]|nr:DegT/DnrJ/EryC1/StrS family aminotransferase [Caldilineaceae bacterium]
MIPVVDLRAEYELVKAEIDAAVRRVLDSGWYILGQEVAAFETEFADWCGVSGAVGVGNGTDALHIALRACGVRAGDEVITVAHTAVATAAAIALTGATPVFVDIDPATYTLDPARLAEAITPRTKAVIPVHLYGHPADLDGILPIAQKAGLRVIEDCAQAHGAEWQGQRVGSFGDLACFSFYPTKNLGALGDGGAVAGNDPALLERVRLLREYGWKPENRYVSEIEGMNSRLDEMQAAILRVKLAHLDGWNEHRRGLAEIYATHLPASVVKPVARPGCRHVYHLYVVRSPDRDSLREKLRAAGVATGIHYPVPVHQQAAYRHLPRVSLPVTEKVAGEILSLPMHSTLTAGQIEQVCAAFS